MEREKLTEEIQKKYDEFDVLWKRILHIEKENAIPKIEIDLGLEKIRALYDVFIQLNSASEEIKKEPVIKEESLDKKDNSKLKNIFLKPKKKEEKQKEEVIIENSQKTNIEETFIVREEEKKIEISKEPVEEIPAPVIEVSEKVQINEKAESSKHEEIQQAPRKEALIDVLAKSDAKQDFATKLQQKAISDITQEIGLADKMLFINKLFDKKPETYSETVTFLNKCSDFSEAYNYLKRQYNWNEEDEITLAFLDIVKRKFN